MRIAPSSESPNLNNSNRGERSLSRLPWRSVSPPGLDSEPPDSQPGALSIRRRPAASSAVLAYPGGFLQGLVDGSNEVTRSLFGPREFPLLLFMPGLGSHWSLLPQGGWCYQLAQFFVQFHRHNAPSRLSVRRTWPRSVSATEWNMRIRMWIVWWGWGAQGRGLSSTRRKLQCFPLFLKPLPSNTISGGPELADVLLLQLSAPRILCRFLSLLPFCCPLPPRGQQTMNYPVGPQNIHAK